MVDKLFDVAVVGLGVMGSAALWQLSRRGFHACGIDQFAPPHARGSSHGQTRAIRKAYFEHPDYVPLLHKAYEGWTDLEDDAGVTLMRLCGMMFAGEPAGEAIRGLEHCYATHELPHERWSAAEAQRHFPQFCVEPHHTAFWDPNGGYLLAEPTVEQCLRLARGRGATLLFDAPLLSWRAADSACELRTQTRTIRAGAIVFTAGAWTSQLLLGLGVPLTVQRKVQIWYGGAGMEALGRDSPVWYMDKAYGGVYGFPVLGEEGMKVAEHTGGEATKSPQAIDQNLRERDEEVVLRCLAETFPGIMPRRTRHEVCMYTMSPDRHFIVDRHPDYTNVIIGAGFSGHGFKFAPVVGEVLADLATTGTTRHSVSFLSFARFK